MGTVKIIKLTILSPAFGEGLTLGSVNAWS